MDEGASPDPVSHHLGRFAVETPATVADADVGGADNDQEVHMATRDSYAPGVPCWVDVAADDPAAARAFYEGLFGWEAEISDDESTGGYANFRQDGVRVAGVGGKMGPPMPDAWSVYVASADVERSLAVAADSGGTVLAGPIEIQGQGTFGMFADPVGTVIGVWQADNHTGAGLINVPNTFCWNELATPDLSTSVAFYSTVFGWQGGEGSEGGAIFTDDTGRALCGAHAAGDGEFPAWSVWFAVEDCDVMVARVVEAGGQVFMEPNDMDFGRGAVVAAPGGAVFGVAALSAADD